MQLQLFSFFSLLFVSPTVLGLCEKSVKEKRCFKPSVPKDVDMKWIMSTDKWRFVRMSQLDLYRTAAGVAGKPISDLAEDDLYYNGCLTLEWGKNGGQTTMFGFNGKNIQFNLKPAGKNTFEFTSESGDIAEQGTTYITLTDNKTFLFFMTCWGDDEASWGVITSSKYLKDKALKQIDDHAKSLGFDEKHFTSLRFETCGKKNKKEGKEEL